jgi:oxygen-dependent protoporphyrinogen oxidase
MKPVDGCQALTDTLASALGPRLVLGASVASIARDGHRWRVESGAGSFDCERLVLALPAAEAARLVAPLAPDLARPIGTLTSESLVSLVHVRRRADVAHPLDGFGYLVPSREGLAHLGTLFSSSIAPGSAPEGEVVLRTLLGGARRPELVDLDDARLLELVEREVGPLLGLTGAPLLVSIRRWRVALPRFDLAHPARLAAIERATPPGLSLLGNWLGGIGVNHLAAAARALAREHARPATVAAAARA